MSHRWTCANSWDNFDLIRARAFEYFPPCVLPLVFRIPLNISLQSIRKRKRVALFCIFIFSFFHFTGTQSWLVFARKISLFRNELASSPCCSISYICFYLGINIRSCLSMHYYSARSARAFVEHFFFKYQSNGEWNNLMETGLSISPATNSRKLKKKKKKIIEARNQCLSYFLDEVNPHSSETGKLWIHLRNNLW